MNVGEVDIIISKVRVGLCSYNYCSGYPQCIHLHYLYVHTRMKHSIRIYYISHVIKAIVDMPISNSA